MKEALLAVSFGTSKPQAMEAICAVEEVLHQAAPGREIFRAFTSPTIRRIRKARGEETDSLEEALDRLAAAGYERILVQPTHFLYGYEYDKIRETVERESESGRFGELILGRPLLSDTEDIRELASVLMAAYDSEENVVFMGHGTEHFANAVYPALQTALRLAGREHMYIGTVEGWPGFDDIMSQLQSCDCRRVTLAPLMLVAGDHAMNDMAGPDEDSWASRLTAAGFAVECRLEGLGLWPGVQAMYQRHVRELL